MYHSEHWKDYCVGGVDGQRFHCANPIKDGDGGAVRSPKFAGCMCDGDNSAARLTEQGRYRVAVWKSGGGRWGNLVLLLKLGGEAARAMEASSEQIEDPCKLQREAAGSTIEGVGRWAQR